MKKLVLRNMLFVLLICLWFVGVPEKIGATAFTYTYKGNPFTTTQPTPQHTPYPEATFTSMRFTINSPANPLVNGGFSFVHRTSGNGTLSANQLGLKPEDLSFKVSDGFKTFTQKDYVFQFAVNGDGNGNITTWDVNIGEPVYVRIFSQNDGGGNHYDLSRTLSQAAYVNSSGFWTQVPTQKLFLDFSQGPATYKNLFDPLPGNTPLTYVKPAFDNPSLITPIVNEVNRIFSNFNIEVLTTKPTSGDFTTISIGGDHTDVPAFDVLGLGSHTLGVAERIDFLNHDKSDSAIVFSENIAGSLGGPTRVERIAQTVAHEAGHLLGLFHVRDSNQLLYPIANDAPTTIGGSSPTVLGSGLENILDNTGTPITQDAASCLSEVSFGGSDLSACYSSPEILDVAAYSAKNSLSSPLHNARIAITSEGDAFPLVIELGTLLPNEDFSFSLERGLVHEAVFLASSTEDGDFDIFSIGDTFDFDNPRVALGQISFALLGPNNTLRDNFSVQLAKTIGNDAILLGELGGVRSLINPVPVPSSVVLFVTGLTALFLITAKKKIGRNV